MRLVYGGNNNNFRSQCQFCFSENVPNSVKPKPNRSLGNVYAQDRSETYVCTYILRSTRDYNQSDDQFMLKTWK